VEARVHYDEGGKRILYWGDVRFSARNTKDQRTTTMFARLRIRLRSWLGLEHFETMLLDELRQQSRRTTRNEDEIARTTRQNLDTARANQRNATSLQSLRREVENLGILVRSIDGALGGVWKTATGHLAPIVALSDTHLQAILDGGFGDWETRQRVQREIDRRKEDDEWARRQGPGSMRERLACLEGTVRELRGWVNPPRTQPKPVAVSNRACEVDFSGLEARAIAEAMRRMPPAEQDADPDQGRAQRTVALMKELRNLVSREGYGRRLVAVQRFACELGVRTEDV
jgi:hypothetical protein